MSRSGIEGGDGLITVVVGALVVLVGVSALREEEPRRMATILLSVVAVAMVVIEHANITRRIEGINDENGLTAGLINVGIGIWIMGVGAVTALLSSLALNGALSSDDEGAPD